GTIAINTKLSFEKAFGVMAHEFTHLGIEDLRFKEPELYQQLETDVNSMTPRERKAYLDYIKSEAGLDDIFDTNYPAGNLFDPADPPARYAITHKVVARTVEGLS